VGNFLCILACTHRSLYRFIRCTDDGLESKAQLDQQAKLDVHTTGFPDRCHIVKKV